MREILDRSRKALEQQYVGDPRFLAAILAQLSSSYADLGDSEIRGTLLARAESLAVASQDGNELTRIRCYMADNLRTEGRYDEAERTIQRADSMIDAATDPRVEAVCLQILADLDNEAGPGGRSLPAIHRAIAIRDSLGETRDMEYVRMLPTLAYSLDNAGQHRDAIPVYARAMAIMDSTGRGGTMARAVLQHDMSVTLIGLGETAEAERSLHEVLEHVAPADPTGQLPAQPLIHYGHVALFNRHVDSASKYFAMLASQSKQERNSYWEGRALFGLAQAQLRLGRLSDARRSVKLFHQVTLKRAIRSTDDQLTDGRILDAWVALATGDTVTAHRLVVDALRSNGYFDGKRQKVFHSALILAAETSLSLGDAAAALDFARAARTTATLDSLCETRSAFVGEAQLVEARALLAGGDTVAARSNLEHAFAALTSGAGAEHPRTREAEALLAAVGSALHSDVISHR